MHRRDYKLIARVIAQTAQDAHQRDRWTAAFMQALHSSPDNFNATKFLEGVTAYSNEVRAGGAPRAGEAQQPPASSTSGRATSAPLAFEAAYGAEGSVDLDESARSARVLMDLERVQLPDDEATQSDAPQHFADEHTPADHYYRS